jgi:hypothetical protein
MFPNFVICKNTTIRIEYNEGSKRETELKVVCRNKDSMRGTAGENKMKTPKHLTFPKENLKTRIPHNRQKSNNRYLFMVHKKLRYKILNSITYVS